MNNENKALDLLDEIASLDCEFDEFDFKALTREIMAADWRELDKITIRLQGVLINRLREKLRALPSETTD